MTKHILIFLVAILMIASCSNKPVDYISTIDYEKNRMVVISGEKTKTANFYDADFVIFGGGLGGIAAALSICSSGRTALLVEETDRIAGCFSYQDTSRYTENRFVETSGTSRSYQLFRTKIRQWYVDKSLTPPNRITNYLPSMTDFGADNFCFQTEAALTAIDSMLAENVSKGKLTIIKRHKVAKVVTFNDRVASMIVVDLDNLVCDQVTGWMFIDATRHGDLLPLAGIPYVEGRESVQELGGPSQSATSISSREGSYVYCPFKPPSKKNGTENTALTIDLIAGTPPDTTGYAVFPAVPTFKRIVSVSTVLEKDISANNNPGPRAAFFKDSIGIGYYPIVVPSANGTGGNTIIPTKPFQIPLGAIIPKTVTNFLAGGSIIGVSYAVSTAYAGPSAEWAIGEAAGEVAAYCAGYKIYTHELLATPEHVRGLQDWLVTKRKVPIYWYDDVRPDDSDFAEAQMKPFVEAGYHEKSTTLHYHETAR